MQRVDQTGSDDDSRSMLIVMKNRNIHPLAKLLFDDETFWRLDVLQVDPPKDGPIKDTALMKASVSDVSNSRSMPSISANFLNRTALPSITGFDAAAPMSPSPRTAVPLEMTATRLLFAV